MAVAFIESEMMFGEYPDQYFFRIEQSGQYKGNLEAHGVKTCEFILFRKKRGKGLLCFVEAKRSLPEDMAAESEEAAIKLHRDFIEEIVLKVKHSLQLYSAILLHKYEQDGVSQELRKNNLKDREFRIVIIVKTARPERLPIYADIFRKELNAEMRVWRMQTIILLNEEQARKKKFIV